MLREVPAPTENADLVREAVTQAQSSGAVPIGDISSFDFKVHRYFAPIPTLEYVQGSHSIREHFVQTYSNLSFVGRAGGNAQFVDDIARELTNYFAELK